jgi:hypothetical protein
MKERLVAVWDWIDYNWRDLVRIGTVAGIALTAVVFFSVLSGLKENAIKGKKDNENQTLILCTLILKSDKEYTDGDAKLIQTICKREIKQAVEQAANPDTGGGSNSASPTNTPVSAPPAGTVPPRINSEQGSVSPSTNKPDNDGVIINPPNAIPLLPDQIHIPSPL